MTLSTIKTIAAKKLNIPLEMITDASFLGGMTNKNYLITISYDKSSGRGKRYVLRIPGAVTDSIITRDNEFFNSQLMSQMKFNVETNYFNPNDGIKITTYLEHSQQLTHQIISNEKYLNAIANKLSLLHNSELVFKNEFNVFDEFDKYISLLKNKELFYQYHPRISQLLDKFYSIRQYHHNNPQLLSPCHNDLVPENILWKENNIYFIDWEYSGMNDPLFDIAAFLLESRLNETNTMKFLGYYLNTSSDKYIKSALIKIRDYQFTQDILWFVWTLVKEENQEFFGDYGKKRIDRALNYVLDENI